MRFTNIFEWIYLHGKATAIGDEPRINMLYDSVSYTLTHVGPSVLELSCVNAVKACQTERNPTATYYFGLYPDNIDLSEVKYFSRSHALLFSGSNNVINL